MEECFRRLALAGGAVGAVRRRRGARRAPRGRRAHSPRAIFREHYFYLLGLLTIKKNICRVKYCTVVRNPTRASPKRTWPASYRERWCERALLSYQRKRVLYTATGGNDFYLRDPSKPPNSSAHVAPHRTVSTLYGPDAH
ncbi:hypothetical protein EVAR_51657_1 [Eumeta japonica]|uniref:Uncharacterized protein n=1 Tax=Eumeta variegata TaxID=151549 RepID=A0A4C1YIM4_EUMVA|nr:hypothetical protein EVAR_51657_1 [Eumeta japonica]